MITLDTENTITANAPGVNPVVTPVIIGSGPFEFWLSIVGEQTDPTSSPPGYETIGLNGVVNSPWTATPQYPPQGRPTYPNWVGAAYLVNNGGSVQTNFGVTGNEIAEYSAMIAGFASSLSAISIVHQTDYSNAGNLGLDTITIPATTPGNLLVVALACADIAGGVNIVSLTDSGGNTFTEVDSANISGTGVDMWYAPVGTSSTSISFHAGTSPFIWIFELADSGGPPPSCQLAVSPASLSFSATAGGSNPAPQSVTITNIGGGGSVPFSFSTGASWISPNSGSGTTPGSVTINISISGLTVGVYTSSITFTSSCGSPPVTVVVELTVAGTAPGCSVIDTNGDVLSTYFPDLQLNIAPATALYTNIIAKSQLSAYETTTEGRQAIVIDFDSGATYARDMGTIFTWPVAARTQLWVWQPSTIEMPEGIYGRASDWDDGGTSGNKFFQGVMVEADSFNALKTFFLQDSDTLTLHSLNECPVAFNQQTEKAFSCTPFTAHSVRVISNDGVEWRVWSARPVFQPWPEATLNWQTELTSLGLTGWGHVREMNVPYVSTSSLILVLTFDAWPAIQIPLPSSNGTQVKTKVTLPPNKFKLIGFRVYSTGVFNLFAKDLELKLKQWGSTGPYEIVKPFGGPSNVGATV